MVIFVIAVLAVWERAIVAMIKWARLIVPTIRGRRIVGLAIC